jgi:hypothetical protein
MNVQDIIQVLNELDTVALIGVIIAVFKLYKNGKNAYDEMIASIKKELKIDELRKDIMRVNILQSINSTPYKAEIIEAEYKKYKDLGGNSYIDMTVSEWRETYEKPLVNKRISSRKKEEK